MHHPALRDWSLRDASGRRKYVNRDERDRFLAAANKAPPKVRTLGLTLAYTGCRITEALNLTGDDVEFADGLVVIRSLKKRDVVVFREIPVPALLLDDLAQVHGLPTLARRRLWPWGRTRAWQLVKALMSDAEIKSLPASPKGLRHGFGAHAVQSGVPLTLIQKWLGHEDIETTAIYLNVIGPEERRIAARMW